MNRELPTTSDADRGRLSGTGADPCPHPGASSLPPLDAPAGVPLGPLVEIDGQIADDLLKVLKAMHALERWGRVMSPIELCSEMDGLIPIFERIQSHAMAMRFMCEEVWGLAAEVASERRQAELRG
jgi:hypothetical protein